MIGKLEFLPHPRIPRRQILQAGAVGLLGLSQAELMALESQSGDAGSSPPKSVIYIFMTGGLSQHESFDMKPDAPDNIRGEFRPIATKTPGLQICEHLPQLAKCSQRYSLVRSLTHPRNDHGEGIHIMNTGRTELPLGLKRAQPQRSDFPSMLSVVSSQIPSSGGLPASVVLPRIVKNVNGAIRPGQHAGMMGAVHDPWVLNAADQCNGYGACPDCFLFSNKPAHKHGVSAVFQAPNFSLPEGLTLSRLNRRGDLLAEIERRQRQLDQQSSIENLTKYRQGALSLLTSGKVRDAFDVHNEDPKSQDRYGRNLFGWSMLMARRLVEVGVRMVQVNMGRGSTWDQHGDLFLSLRKLLPPFDQSLTALLDDLKERGMLESTLVVVAGEFGRTPKISKLSVYKSPGRDHWGATQSVLLAGAGIRGGNVIGATDAIGAYPIRSPQSPENFAATIYQSLGIPRNAHWHDVTGRPVPVHHAEPISGAV